jgi:peptidoglycan/LPS O-acetylase OafA/YrhL
MDLYHSYQAKKRFGSLDGLRAISILAVIWHHAAPEWINNVLVDMGTYGVTLFFAISGFLITTLLLRERDKNSRIDLKAFYMRRVLRILPLYYGVLLLYIIIVAVLEKDAAIKQDFFSNLIYFATYTSNLFVELDGRVIFYFSWSLAAEEQFYLVWPPLLYLAARNSRALALLTVVLVAVIIDRLVVGHMLGFVPIAIVGGSLLAVILHTRAGFQVVAKFLGQKWSVIVITAALVVALSLVASTIIIHLLMVLLVGCCVIREDHVIAPALSIKWIAYIGQISYGMYMLHMLCLNAVNKGLSFIGWDSGGYEVFVLTVLASIVAAGLSFKYFESYFLKLKDKFSSHPKPIEPPVSIPVIPVTAPLVAQIITPLQADQDRV